MTNTQKSITLGDDYDPSITVSVTDAPAADTVVEIETSKYSQMSGRTVPATYAATPNETLVILRLLLRGAKTTIDAEKLHEVINEELDQQT